MAIPVFLATHVYGIRVHGFGYLKHFVGPIRSIFALPLMILMFVIEFIGHLVRPVTLSVRLFGNMVAKHYLLAVLGAAGPLDHSNRHTLTRRARECDTGLCFHPACNIVSCWCR